jgi:hypothetical protein
MMSMYFTVVLLALVVSAGRSRRPLADWYGAAP